MQKGKRENKERGDNVRLMTSFPGHNSQVRIGENGDYEQYFQISQ